MKPFAPLTPESPPTPRQCEVLAVMLRVAMYKGGPATIREIGDALDIRSPNGVVAHLRLLERRGLVRHGERGAWHLAGVEMHIANSPAGDQLKRFTAYMIEGEGRRAA